MPAYRRVKDVGFQQRNHQDHGLLVSVKGSRLNCTAEKAAENFQKESTSSFFNFKESQKKNIHAPVT